MMTQRYNIVNKIGWISSLLVLAAVAVSQANQVLLDIQPRAIRITEAATLKLTFIDLHPPQSPALPDIPGFDLHYIGQESQFNFINGQQERRLTFNYRLQPRNTGQFRIGPFSMSVQGKNIDFDPITVDVLPPTDGVTDQKSVSVDDLIFARVRLPRTEVYLQERFDVDVLLYFRGVQIDRGIQFQNLPSTGLNLEDLQEIGSTREAIGSEIYEVRRFRMRGTALTAGKFQLAPMLRINVIVRRESRNRDPFFGGFDALFGRHETQPLVVPTEAMDVLIRPLPMDGRPAQFGGAVGKFNMDMTVQPTDVQAGDPVTLTIRITGQGNFETISMPSLHLGDDFRRYDPKLIASGRDHKVFEQVFIPRGDHITEIPPVTFAYFDPEAGKYQTIVRGPHPLMVKGGASDAPHVVQAPSILPAMDRAPLGIDIVDLKRHPVRWDSVPTPMKSTELSLPAHALPVLAVALLFAIQHRRRQINQDVTRRRRTQAPKSARAALRSAESALARSDIPAFYQALWQALADYIAHRCNLEAGEISPPLILSRLEAGGLRRETIDEVKQLLQSCDEIRFGLARHDEAADLLRKRLQSTQDILRACERIRL